MRWRGTNGSSPARLNAIKRAIDPVELLDNFGMCYRIALLDKLPAHHGQALMHRLRIGILGETISEVVHCGCHSRGQFIRKIH
jgi:hypothetical protein